MTAVPADRPLRTEVVDNPWNDPDLEMRRGRFRIAGRFALQFGFSAVHTLQQTCIINWMEREWHSDCTVVYAMNPTFDICEVGNLIPWYQLEFEEDTDSNIIGFRFVRVDDPNYEEPRV